jgi:hypothetical protein
MCTSCQPLAASVVSSPSMPGSSISFQTLSCMERNLNGGGSPRPGMGSVMMARYRLFTRAFSAACKPGTAFGTSRAFNEPACKDTSCMLDVEAPVIPPSMLSQAARPMVNAFATIRELTRNCSWSSRYVRSGLRSRAKQISMRRWMPDRRNRAGVGFHSRDGVACFIYTFTKLKSLSSRNMIDCVLLHASFIYALLFHWLG